MTRSETVFVRRTGNTPLRLTGFGLQAQASSRATSGPRENRWWEIELWSDDRSPAGPGQPHCLVIRYRTQWQGELGRDDAEIMPRSQVADALREHPALDVVAGFPAREDYADRQAKLLAALRAGWEDAVSDLLEVATAWELADG